MRLGLYCATFSTCAKSSSTGVERPKIVTETFSVLRSGVHFFHYAGEVRKRPLADAHLLAAIE